MNFNKILIVDDSRTARILIVQSLMDQGLERSLFMEAENGLQAVDLIRRDRYDLIITDIIMPKMDGNTFIHKTRLSELNGKTPIIILTSLGKRGLEPGILENSQIYLLQKPLEREKLKSVLEVIHGN